MRFRSQARDDRILAQRLEYALRHPVSADAVLIEHQGGGALLRRRRRGAARGE